MNRHYRGVLISIAAVAAALAVATWALAWGGVGNAGFESGLAPWETLSPAAHQVAVVGPENGEFPAYNEWGVLVQPYSGSKMLRIGSPSRIADKQLRGTTTVRQSFIADGNVLRIAFRAFSWEHRGQDTVRIGITDAGGASAGVLVPPIAWKQSPDSTRTASALPIVMPMDVGNPVDLVDTGWVAANITGLVDGASYTISYSIVTTHDDGLPTWCYFDEGEYPPPVASFKYAPGPFAATPQNPHEGDVIGLYGDFSYSPDALYGTLISAYDWTIAGKGMSDAFGSKAINYIVIADQGSYDVTLTVTDDDGRQNATAQTITVENWAPRVNALNAEVIPGRETSLTARFIDPGWLDTHAASWSIPGVSTTSGLTLADHIPYVSTGLASGSATAPWDATPYSRLTGHVNVYDGTDIGSDDVTLTVVPDDPMRREPADNSIETAPQLSSDGVYLSYIQSAGDVDFYEIRLQDGSELPYNTEVLVNLTGLAADYDLVLMSQVPTGTEYQFKDAPGMYAPGMNAPGMYAPGMYAPGMYAPGMYAPGMYAPGMYAPGMYAPGMYAPGMNAPGMHAPAMQSPGMYAPGMYAPGMYAPFNTAPGMYAPGMYAPGMHAPGMYAPGMHAPGMYAPGMYAPTPLEGFALSDMSYTGLTNGNSQGGDFSVAQLGIDLSAENLQVAGFSANAGLGDEAVLTRVDQVYQKMFVAVIGATGAHSDEPYSLQIETSQPLNNLYIWNEGVDTPALVDNATTTPAITPLPAGETTTTLFVTQWERVAATYSPEEQASLRAQLNSFALRPDIRGAVLSVPSAFYDAWDTNPESVTAANVVAEGIRALIKDQLLANPSIKYVVLVGSDRIVPYRRVTDQAIIGNERYYADTGAYLKGTSPLLASMMTRNNLTDDYYVDMEPTPFQGRALYIPDVAVGRLVETPSEILNQLQAFADAGGVLQPQTSLVTGLDFMMDGAQSVAGTFSLGNLSPATLISDTWSKSDLMTDWLGLGPDIANVNAHFAHWGGISAAGYLASQQTQAWDPSEYLMSTEVSAAVSPAGIPSLKNKLAFSMGCHAGLNVPDEDAFPLDPSFGINAALDLPQAMARQGAVFMGSTGFGLGESDGIAGTEQLIGNLSRTLLKGETTVGDALKEAKQQFLLGQGVLSVYDEKSSIEFCLYGLPQYRIQSSGVPQLGSAGTGMTSPISASALGAASFMGTPPSSLSLHVIDRDVQTDTTHSYALASTGSGDYFTADGDAQATTPRPIQPRVSRDVDASNTDWVHGVLLLGGSFKTLTDFNPKNAQITTEWNTEMMEFQVSESGWWPSPISGVNSIQSATDTTQRLVVIPAEFKPYAPLQSTVVGWERLYGDLTVELLRSSNSTDFRGPTVAAVTLPADDPSLMTVTIKATDDSGVSRIVIAYTVVTADGGSIQSISVTPIDPFAGMYTLTIPVPPGATIEDISALVQTVDGAGNVAQVTGTEVTPHSLAVELAADSTELSLDTPIEFTARIPGYYSAVVPPISWSIDFGDGERASGVISGDLPLDGNGVPYLSMSHQYASDDAPVTATFRIADMAGGSGSATCLLSPPPKNIVWVATDGSDANSGSEARPFRHVAYALSRLGASGFATSTVNVQPGTYTEDISLIGGVHVVSVAGAASTTLAGTGSGPVVTAAYGAASYQAVLEGFTISGGSTTAEGGGVRVQGVSPTIVDCAIISNSAANGGGAAAIGGSPVFIRTRFEGNTASGSGGALWIGSGATVSATQCTLTGNHALGGNGGAVAVGSGSLTTYLCGLTGNDGISGGAISLAGAGATAVLGQSEVSSNRASSDGGAAVLSGGSRIELGRCTVSGNTAARNGGAIAATASTVTVNGSRLAFNVAGPYGGALWSTGGSSATFGASTLLSNRATSMGGGVYSVASQLRFTNSIIARNTLPKTTKTYGGGVYVAGIQPIFTSTTVVDNDAYAWGGIGSPDVKSILFDCIVASTTTSASNTIHRALAGYTFLAFPTKSQFVDYGSGDIKSSTGDPGFVNASDPVNPNYHLIATSPCIDSGAASWLTYAAPATDMDGVARPQGAGWDMGAYERARY